MRYFEAKPIKVRHNVLLRTRVGHDPSRSHHDEIIQGLKDLVPRLVDHCHNGEA